MVGTTCDCEIAPVRFCRYVDCTGRRMRHELLLPLTIECGRSSATLRTAVRDDTGWPGYFEIINASANANITGRSWRDSTRSKNSAFYRYHSVMEVFGVLSQVVKGSYVRFCLNQGTKRTCPVQQLVSGKISFSCCLANCTVHWDLYIKILKLTKQKTSREHRTVGSWRF